MIIDLVSLREESEAFSRLRHGAEDPRRESCAKRFFHEEYIKRALPLPSSHEERVERLLIEIRDLLLSK